MTVTAVPNTVRQRITGALFTSQSLFSAAIIASFTLTPIIAADLSGSDSTAGIPSTLTLLGRAAAAYPLGWLMDKAGRRLGLSGGLYAGAFRGSYGRICYPLRLIFRLSGGGRTGRNGARAH
ncbi:MAG: MFS transporter [Chloroflexi bacterium]|nr:MFS transporter [Chloroflexota bacterium]